MNSGDVINELAQLFHNKGVAKQVRIEFIMKMIKGNVVSDPEYKEIILKLRTLLTDPSTYQKIFTTFGEKVLKTSLDQFYSPEELCHFIGNCIITNEISTILEPACGTGNLCDFINSGKVTYIDISIEVCKLLELKQALVKPKHSFEILNVNSLKNVERYYDFVIINPPFGVRTVETDQDILSRYKISKGKKKQQLGKLFVEFGLNSLNENGILFLILPLGYLTNSSEKDIRKMIIDDYKLLAILELPKNSFKQSGTGVDTCLMIIQNKKEEDYNIFIDSVIEYKDSTKSNHFGFVDSLKKLKVFASKEDIKELQWSNSKLEFSQISRKEIVYDDYSLNLNRYTEEYLQLIKCVTNDKHFKLKEVSASKDLIKNIKIDRNKEYIYLDISQVGRGIYSTKNAIKGSELPGRAKYQVESGDIIVSKLKGKISFCMIQDCTNLVVSNGFHVVRISQENFRLSFYNFLFKEQFNQQFNCLAKGSIMADVKHDDFFKKIIIPCSKNLRETKELIEVYAKFHNLKKILEK